eukprot:3542710-Rhodomonas_salina.1
MNADLLQRVQVIGCNDENREPVKLNVAGPLPTRILPPLPYFSARILLFPPYLSTLSVHSTSKDKQPRSRCPVPRTG